MCFACFACFIFWIFNMLMMMRLKMERRKSVTSSHVIALTDRERRTVRRTYDRKGFQKNTKLETSQSFFVHQCSKDLEK